MDLAQRAAAALGHAPSTYADAAAALLRGGVIGPDDHRFLKAVIGFRNVVVHEYLAVDTEIVDRILSKREYRRVLTLAEKIYRELKRRGLDP